MRCGCSDCEGGSGLGGSGLGTNADRLDRFDSEPPSPESRVPSPESRVPSPQSPSPESPVPVPSPEPRTPNPDVPPDPELHRLEELSRRFTLFDGPGVPAVARYADRHISLHCPLSCEFPRRTAASSWLLRPAVLPSETASCDPKRGTLSADRRSAALRTETGEVGRQVACGTVSHARLCMQFD